MGLLDGTQVLGGEIRVRVRPNGVPDQMLRRMVPTLESQGAHVTELFDRELQFVVDRESEAAAMNDISFLHRGSVYLFERKGSWMVRYAVTANQTIWWIGPALVAVLLVAWLVFRFPLNCSFALPLPAFSLAALGQRAAMQKRARRWLGDAIDSQLGLDC